MSHWLDQICSRFSPSDSLLLAVVCDVTGASPDGDRGIVFLNREVAATNIVNDKRRELIIRDAKSLLLKKNSGQISPILWEKFSPGKMENGGLFISSLRGPVTNTGYVTREHKYATETISGWRFERGLP